jgi:hypothetical protein
LNTIFGYFKNFRSIFFTKNIKFTIEIPPKIPRKIIPQKSFLFKIKINPFPSFTIPSSSIAVYRLPNEFLIECKTLISFQYKTSSSRNKRKGLKRFSSPKWCHLGFFFIFIIDMWNKKDEKVTERVKNYFKEAIYKKVLNIFNDITTRGSVLDSCALINIRFMFDCYVKNREGIKEKEKYRSFLSSYFILSYSEVFWRRGRFIARLERARERVLIGCETFLG